VSEAVEVFVNLLDDGVHVWRPVQAERLHGDVYRIMDQPYDREIETWQFASGGAVVCGATHHHEGLAGPPLLG